jgi:hypothetical protein
MKHLTYAFKVLLAVILFLGSRIVSPASHQALICSVDDTQDDFKVYPSQLVYTSKQFLYYQIIDGLTVLVVNQQTMRFNRLSNLNLLSHSTMDPSKSPENYQLFSGTCKIAPLPD